MAPLTPLFALPVTLLSAVVSAVWLLRKRLLVVHVVGRSMEPALRAGDRLLVRRGRPHAFRRGTVAVFHGNLDPLSDDSGPPASALAPPDGTDPPGSHGWFVKRIVAVAGDAVPRRFGGFLAETRYARVPIGTVVVIGDNPGHSFDSRHVGFLPADRIVGVVLRPLGRRGDNHGFRRMPVRPGKDTEDTSGPGPGGRPAAEAEKRRPIHEPE